MSRPFQNLNSTGSMVFDGLAAVCWFIHMSTTVAHPRVINISPGQLYTFIFTQDGVGNHPMMWPDNCVNAAPIDPAPNSLTVQNFIADQGGFLIANVPPSGVQP